MYKKVQSRMKQSNTSAIYIFNRIHHLTTDTFRFIQSAVAPCRTHRGNTVKNKEETNDRENLLDRELIKFKCISFYGMLCYWQKYLTYFVNTTPNKMNRLPVEIGHTFLECLPRSHFLFVVSFSHLLVALKRIRLLFHSTLQ